MRERTHVRRLAGLTTAMLGLTGLFASLTLVAISKPGAAAAFAAAGVVLVVAGLRLLPARTP